MQRRLAELKEWCPEQSCCGGREVAVTALKRRISRLLHCTQGLTSRSKRRIAEWSEITNNVSEILQRMNIFLINLFPVKSFKVPS